jgi:hypothetical protein
MIFNSQVFNKGFDVATEGTEPTCRVTGSEHDLQHYLSPER